MKNVFNVLEQIGLLPILEGIDATNAFALAETLSSAGLGIVDLPLSTNDFSDVARQLRNAPLQFFSVSGVASTKDCQLAVESGASLLLAYALYPEIAVWCREHEIAYVPCCATSSEIASAMELGLSTVLYTPSTEPAPCAQLYEIWKDQGLRFIVSGGVTEENHLLYADKPYITAVCGSFLCPSAIVLTGDFSVLGQRARLIYHDMLGFELGHIGISTATPEEGHQLADDIGELFGAPAEHGHVGNWNLLRGIEVVNGKGPGLHGHIAVQCNNVIRAIFYLENKGHKIKSDSFRYRYPGRLSFAYLEEEYGGFAIHLMLRWTAP